MTEQAYVHFEKIVINAEKLYKMTAFEGIERYDKLPREYLNAAPCICTSEDGEWFETHEDAYQVGALFTKDEVQAFQKYISAAGKRLVEINRRLKKDDGNHYGTFIMPV